MINISKYFIIRVTQKISSQEWKKGLRMENRRIFRLEKTSTLLDAETYSWRSAEGAIAALKKGEALAIILVTSKTLSEVVLLHEELGLEDPFIFENGGGIAASKGTPFCEHLISWEPKVNEFYMEGFVVFLRNEI